MHNIFLIYILIGAFAGLVSGLLGVGGGAFIMSMLLYLFRLQGMSINIAAPMAIATALAIISLNSVIYIVLQNKSRNIDWPAFKKFTLAMCVGAIVLGPFMNNYLNGKIISFVIIAMCLLVTYQMFFTKKVVATQSTLKPNTAALLSMPLGALCVLSGISGAGLTLSLLNMSHPNVDKNIHTAAAIGFPISVIGVCIYIFLGISANDLPDYALGYVYVPALLFVSLFSLMFTYIGVLFSRSINKKYIRRGMGILMLTISIKLILNLGIIK